MSNNLKVKASLFTLILAFMAIGTFAIAKEVMKKDNSTEAPAVVLTETWYFTGDDEADPTDPDNYSKEPPTEDPCQFPYETICQINAPETLDGKPDMGAFVTGTISVQDQIEEALQSIVDENPTTNTTVENFRLHLL